jgi:hypothetical protein
MEIVGSEQPLQIVDLKPAVIGPTTASLEWLRKDVGDCSKDC